MNIKRLQKNVGKRIAIVLVVLGLLAAVTFAVMVVRDSHQAEHEKLKTQLNTTNADTRTLQDKIARARVSMDVFNTINSRGVGKMELDRDAARRLLDQMKEGYRLNSLTVTIGPVTNEQGGKEGMQLVSSNVVLTMEAFTDEMIIGFVNAVKQHFPGYVHLKRFELGRNAEVSRDALSNAAKGRTASLAKAEVEFKWMGIRQPEAKPADATAPAAVPPVNAPPPAAGKL